MSTEPRVSVILPACRAEATLPAAVRSLLGRRGRPGRRSSPRTTGARTGRAGARRHPRRLVAAGVDWGLRQRRGQCPQRGAGLGAWRHPVQSGCGRPIPVGPPGAAGAACARPRRDGGQRRSAPDRTAACTSGRGALLRAPPCRSRRMGFCGRASLSFRCSGASSLARAGPRSRSPPTCCLIWSCCAPPPR